MDAHKNLLSLDFATSEPFEQIAQINLSQSVPRAWIDDLEPRLDHLIPANQVVLHEAFDAHIHVEVNPRVCVPTIDTKGLHDSIHDIIELILFNVRELQEAVKSDLVLHLELTEQICHLVHLLL